MSELGALIVEQASAMNDQRRLGMDFMREEAKRDFRSVIEAYERALLDANSRIPTMLHIAIEQLRKKYAP